MTILGQFLRGLAWQQPAPHDRYWKWWLRGAAITTVCVVGMIPLAFVIFGIAVGYWLGSRT